KSHLASLPFSPSPLCKKLSVSESPSYMVKPGVSLTLSCRISITSYCLHWIRQPEGKAFKISFTLDTSSNTEFLQVKNFQTEDTAVYYCARDSQ
uniref:Ig-like domain-containing protein n=1 Tax=Hucho hucho TaxID=62062 RepID=A0A4W5K7S8_9TELE